MERLPIAVKPLGAGATGELGTACVCLSPGSLAGSRWLWEPLCPQTQCFQQLEGKAYLPAPPGPTRTREPHSRQRSGCGRGWGPGHEPRVAMARVPRKAETTHAMTPESKEDVPWADTPPSTCAEG